MSETSLPFDEKVYPGQRLKAEWERSISNPEEFWAEKAKAIDWFKTWDRVLDDSKRPFYKWFSGGVLNISYNALDRHLKTSKKNMLAYIWEGDNGEVRTFTYYQLYREVNKFAKILKDRAQERRPSVCLSADDSRAPDYSACLCTIGCCSHRDFFGFQRRSVGRQS